jgi:hypothetical protein
MIKGLHDTKRIAESIIKLSDGDCELCGLKIGGQYLALAQVFPCPTEEGHTIDIFYQVACKECHRLIRALLEARRSLRQEDPRNDNGEGV